MKIKRIKKIKHLDNVFNLRIKDNHNYFANNICVSNCHQAKADSFNKILSRTLINAYYQFGVSGTFQDDGFAEFISIQALTGPKVSIVRAKELQDKGIISNVHVSQIQLNHNDPEFRDRLKEIRKGANSGAEAYRLEGDYIRNSEKRMEFIAKLLHKMKTNTLVLFNIIEYGIDLKTYLEEYFDNNYKEGDVKTIFYIIHGGVKKDEREKIKKELEKNDGVVRILVATYGTLSTGVSINNLHNIIFTESFKAEQRIIQSIGRALRLFKTKLVAKIYDLVDVYTEEKSKNALERHGEERLKMYQKHQYPCKVSKFVL